MLSRFDRRPWVVVEHSNGPNGYSARFKGGLQSRVDAEQSARGKNIHNPFGRVYHVAYWWEARPAAAEEIESLAEMTFAEEHPNV